MKKVYISQFTKCSCGHEMGSHRMWDPPAACRIEGCECEGFYQVHRDGSVTTVPPDVHELARQDREVRT